MVGNGSNGDMELATLTAGEGIDVTNADGAITIASEVGTGSNLGALSLQLLRRDGLHLLRSEL